MQDVKQQKAERTKLFEDTYNNIIPKRVPIKVQLCKEVVAELAGMDVRYVNWNIPSIASAAEAICNRVYSDVCPANFHSTRYPSHYEITKSISFRMSENGFVQHPEIFGLALEDYDYLITNPLECLLERVIPRLYKGLDWEKPVLAAINLSKAVAAKNQDMFPCFGFSDHLNAAYGYYSDDGRARSMTTAPFDFIADQLRGFSNIPADMRRVPDKVAAACDAVYPLMVKAGVPQILNSNSRAYSFLHMPTYMSEKNFSKFWWPSFLKMCQKHASMGIQTEAFCEDNWDRYLDYLLELPSNSILSFEYGDMQKIKDKLGKKHIITGLYPLTLLKTGTRQQCIDKAKEMLDILAPGAKYIFNFDKVIITANSINLDNLVAVTEYVRDHSKYDNAGETAGMPFNKEDYTAPPCDWADSQYYLNAEQYRAANALITEDGAKRLQALDDSLYTFLINLLF